MALDMRKVLIIVPALNEERSIKFVVESIKKLFPDAHILVINDGSSDRTAEVAYENGAMAVSLPFNLGIGGAVQTGFKVAWQEGYEIAVQIDGDAQHDPAYLPQIVEPLLSGKLDMCIGSRFLEDFSGYKSTFARRMGIQLFAGLLSFLTGVKLTDPTSGFRAINRKLIKEFSQSYPIDFPEPEAIKMAKRFEAKIGEVPVGMRKRLSGKSSIRYFASFYYMVKVTLAILIETLRSTKKKELS